MEFLDYHSFDVRNGTIFFVDSFIKTVQFCFNSLLKETKHVVTVKIEFEHRGIWKSFTLFGSFGLMGFWCKHENQFFRFTSHSKLVRLSDCFLLESLTFLLDVTDSLEQQKLSSLLALLIVTPSQFRFKDQKTRRLLVYKPKIYDWLLDGTNQNSNYRETLVRNSRQFSFTSTLLGYFLGPVKFFMQYLRRMVFFNRKIFHTFKVFDRDLGARNRTCSYVEKWVHETKII